MEASDIVVAATPDNAGLRGRYIHNNVHYYIMRKATCGFSTFTALGAPLVSLENLWDAAVLEINDLELDKIVS